VLQNILVKEFCDMLTLAPSLDQALHCKSVFVTPRNKFWNKKSIVYPQLFSSNDQKQKRLAQCGA